MAEPSFRELEHAGWSSRATGYDDRFSPITRQAIAPLLAAIRLDRPGLRCLDICCGTGHVAGAMAARGAIVEGVDFVEAMVAIARRNYPAVTFRQGDAESLSFLDHVFDGALCAFGLPHLADPDAGLCEAHRVLKRGGRYAFATWLPPEKGFDLLRLVSEAIKQHGDASVSPSAPPRFRFADVDAARDTLESVGFEEVGDTAGVATWNCTNGEAVVDLIYRGAVRTPMLIDAQTPQARERILTAIAAAAEAFRKGDHIELRWPYVVVSAIKGA